MADYTLKVRRYQPEAEASDGGAAGPYWEQFDVDLDPTLSVLDGLLQARDRDDGSLAVRCSCRAAICGSCGVKINGKSTLACLTQLGDAHEAANRRNGGSEPIVVEPMGNMPVIKDLVTDMESTHWEKMRRVTPWLLDDGDPPERERIVEPDSMVDITQTIACIQCGACVSSCLSMEVDPGFIGPAALAKAYRFVGDPRDVETDGAPLRPRPGPAGDLRLHPLLLLRRCLSQGRRADGPDHAPAPARRRRGRDRRPQQRPPPRDRVREDHRAEGNARRVAAVAGVIRAGDSRASCGPPRSRTC